ARVEHPGLEPEPARGGHRGKSKGVPPRVPPCSGSSPGGRTLLLMGGPATSAPPSRPAAPNAWGPLRVPVFRALWIATVASNVGSWTHAPAATWLMTSLTTSTLLVALMQTPSSLPVLVLALPAGALADIVDRRRVLIAAQSWMLGAATLMGVLALAGVMTPDRLLFFTFLLGLGNG